jgi:hypothetical protein
VEDKKKITAAISAVWHQIKTEAEIIDKNEGEAPAQQVIARGSNAPEKVASFWKNSGRQAQMQMRTLMQMRTFSTSRRN